MLPTLALCFLVLRLIEANDVPFMLNGTETIVPDYPDEAKILADIAVAEFPESAVPQFELNMSALFCQVFERATKEYFGQSFRNRNRSIAFDDSLCGVEVIDIHPVRSHVQLVFVVLYDNQPVDGMVSVREISKLTLSHLSAAVGYPVVGIRGLKQSINSEPVQWWIAVLIIGCGLIVCFCGWLMMFFYYNICAAPISQPANGFSPKRRRYDTQAAAPMPVIMEDIEVAAQSEPQPESVTTVIVEEEKPMEERIEEILARAAESPPPPPPAVPPPPSEPHSTQASPQISRPTQPPPLDPTDILEPLPFPMPERWSPYYAGDRVEAIRLAQQQTHNIGLHPQPALPMDEDVLVIRKSDSFHQSDEI